MILFRKTEIKKQRLLDKIICKLQLQISFMHIIIPKNASPEEVKKALEQFEKKRKSRKSKSEKGSIAKHFGSNPNEVDGLKFQKKVRSEWD